MNAGLERRLAGAGGRLGRLAAPARPVPGALGRRRRGGPLRLGRGRGRGGLGGPGDRRIFQLLRDLADVILVAAGTVRNEGYGYPAFGADRRARRSAPNAG